MTKCDDISMLQRRTWLGAGALWVALPAAFAQPARKVYRIGTTGKRHEAACR
jgi:hypothetical protein